MRIVYLGSGRFGIPCLDAIAASSHLLTFVVTQPTKAAGRGRKPKPTPVALWANDHSIPHVEADDINTPQIIEQIAAYKPELIVVIAFGQKIGRKVLEVAPNAAVNVHASLLPKYRGAAPINWAIINGETETGISIITVADRMDAGDILAQLSTPIEPDQTAGHLHDRLAEMAAPLLVETINKIADGTAAYEKQDDSKATRAPKLKKSDGFLDFAEPAEMLRRKILGFWPWPGAAALYVSQTGGKSERVTIAVADMVWTQDSQGRPPGILDENLNVVCGKAALRITQIKPEGSRLMTFAAFVNGRATRPGDAFKKIEP